MSDSTFLTRVELLNYKSITHCNVELGPLMFLVGPNGAGKSNFLDALHFVSDALNNSLEYAILQRISVIRVLHYAQLLPAHFSICLDFVLPTGETGTYSFCIETKYGNDYAVKSEDCRLFSGDITTQKAYFRVENGVVETSEGIAPPALLNRLYLVNAAGLPAFRPVYDALSRMAFYNLNPNAIRDSRQVDAGERLTSQGGNITSVLVAMGKNVPDTRRRIEEYLAAIVPDMIGIVTENFGTIERLYFRQDIPAPPNGAFFPAPSMSDGTLRALGILVALFQGESENNPICLVGIEEPETGLHPAAVEALLDAMSEASESKQILVTSHSADLLDNKDITADMLLAVVAEDGVTKIGPIDRAGQYALREHLYTAGELQRINQLRPDLSAEAETETEDAPRPVDNAA